MKDRDVSRRKLLLGGGGLVVAALGAWGIASAVSGEEKDPDAPADIAAKEAPMLAALVAAGTLPKLADRLPKNPMVVQIVDRLGSYGGTWRTAGVGVEDASSWMLQTMFYDNIVAWDSAFKGNGSISDVKPNLAESFTSNKEGTEYTFKLRQGIKWSDGKPFTADDVVFAVNDIQVHKDVTPSPSARFRGLDGKPAKATKVDDFTVTITFPSPNGLFLQGMCSAGGHVLAAPKHYLQQFHGDYMTGTKPADWVKAFAAKNNPFNNADRPTLTAWKVVTGVSSGSQAVAERNPYYWKTDTAGRQLPYLDKVVYSVVADAEVALAQALNGQIDLHSRTINTTRNKPVLADARQRSGFAFFEVKTGIMNHDEIMFNLTHKDPVKRQIFGNKDFRIGLSHAINRQELIDAVYAGQGKPWQVAPRPGSPFSDDAMGTQYTEYSVDKANQFLDKAGFAKSGQSRLGPDGKPIEFVVLIPTNNPTSAQAFEFIGRAWAAVGIKATVQSVDETLWFERTTAGNHDVSVGKGDGGDNPILYPYRYIPFAPRTSHFATEWARWFESKGASGEKPPANVEKWQANYRQIQGITDSAEALKLMKEILAGLKEEFITIGTVLPIDGYGIVKNNVHNVPKSIPGDLTFPNLAAAHPEQFFMS